MLIFVHLGLTVLLFLLNCFNPLNCLPGGLQPFPPERCVEVPVKESESTDEKKEEKPASTKPAIRTPCPEESASHNSYLSYFWFFPYESFMFLQIDLFLNPENYTVESDISPSHRFKGMGMYQRCADIKSRIKWE